MLGSILNLGEALCADIERQPEELAGIRCLLACI
jgi:hypothetical protein